MKSQIKFLKTDILIQKILFLLILLSALPVITLSITLPILGVWQLFSAFKTRDWFEDEMRKKYLRNCFAYLGLMFGAFYLMEYFRGVDAYIFVLFLVFVLIPMFIAVWYYVVTKHSLEDLLKKGIVDIPEEMENILDSEEIFKPIKKL